MTLLKTTALLAVSIAMLGASTSVSAQISTGTEYRQANDTATDSFGEDYSSQQRAAQEARDSGRVMSKTASRFIKSSTEANAEGDYAEAVKLSVKGLATHGLTPYERSLLYQINAEASLKNRDLIGAEKSYEMALATGAMNEEESAPVESFLAKLKSVNAQ